MAALAAQYVWYVTPCVLPYVQAVTIVGYCEAQEYTFVNMFVLALATLVHIALVATFVSGMDMGFQGICLATSL